MITYTPFKNDTQFALAVCTSIFEQRNDNKKREKTSAHAVHTRKICMADKKNKMQK